MNIEINENIESGEKKVSLSYTVNDTILIEKFGDSVSGIVINRLADDLYISLKENVFKAATGRIVEKISEKVDKVIEGIFK